MTKTPHMPAAGPGKSPAEYLGQTGVVAGETTFARIGFLLSGILQGVEITRSGNLPAAAPPEMPAAATSIVEAPAASRSRPKPTQGGPAAR